MDDGAFRFGDDAVRSVQSWVQQLGWGVAHLCNIRNSDGAGAPIAPMLMGARANLVLPDLLLADFSGRGRPLLLVEVKHKTLAGVECYKLNRDKVHGIGRRSWLDQQRIEAITGIPVWTVVLESLSGQLLAARLTRMVPDDTWDDDSRPGVDRGGMVYFRRSRFALLAQLERASRPDAA